MSPTSDLGAPGAPLVWRFPRRGTIFGALAMMAIVMTGGVITILALFAIAIMVAPFMLIGGEDVGPKAGLTVYLLLIAFFLGREAWRAHGAATQAQRDRHLNRLAFACIVLASFVLSLVILEREWPM